MSSGYLNAAACKGNDNVRVLTSAYFLASNAGLDNDPNVFAWLNKAAALSGDDGPIQKLTLKDVLDRKPEWDRRESDTWEILSRGEIPMFLAAQSLNKSLIELTLFPAVANLAESDPRRRGAISAYSGKRQPAPIKTCGSVGIDATAFLTLSFLNLLDESLDTFTTVHLPHSFCSWLFDEKQKASFHQPSRIRDAHQVRHILATDLLEKFIPSTVANSDLSAQVGDDLAILIAEAEKVRNDDDTQRIVIRSYPVHRLASLLEEEADLTEHVAVMGSCRSVIEKLRQKGQITAEEEKRARAYLQLYEKPWPNQPEIRDGAILYLDDLSITYFIHLGILEKLKYAGFRPIASPTALSEANKLIKYESISGKVNEAIEHIRSAVSSRIESGKIKVHRRIKADKPEKQSIFEHPTAGLINLAGECNAIISDDRFLNQHANIDDGNNQVPIYTTLDLLDALVITGTITLESKLEYKTLLRRSGYFLIPVCDAELTTLLEAAEVSNGKIVESAELKTIREYILHVRMSNWLQLPKEATWLDSTFKVFIRVMRGLWKVEAELSGVRARSNWIMDQVDIRGWAQCIGKENGDIIVKNGRGAQILLVLTPPADAPQDLKDAYWSWVEDSVLAPIKEQFHDLYSWIVERQRRLITEMANMRMTDGEAR